MRSTLARRVSSRVAHEMRFISVCLVVLCPRTVVSVFRFTMRLSCYTYDQISEYYRSRCAALCLRAQELFRDQVVYCACARKRPSVRSATRAIIVGRLSGACARKRLQKSINTNSFHDHVQEDIISYRKL